MPAHETWLLLFDGECPTCCRFADMVKRFDHDKLIVPIALQEHYETSKSIPLDDLKEELHILGSRGSLLRGGEALATIIALVPAARPFRWMIENRLGRKGSDVVYRILNRMRRCPSCKKERPGG